MGVTTIVAGNCGGSALDVGAALDDDPRGRRRRSTSRRSSATTPCARAVMGTAERRADASASWRRWRRSSGKAMADGAVGFSTGLQYVPGTYADNDEIVGAGEGGGNSRAALYASHMRNEGTELEQAVAEAIRVGEAARLPVQISHLKVDSPSRWGASAKALAMIDAARARGVRRQRRSVRLHAASSNLGIRFPSWALEGGQARDRDAARRRRRPGRRSRARCARCSPSAASTDLLVRRVADYPADPSLNGLTMPQVAEKLQGRARSSTPSSRRRAHAAAPAARRWSTTS